MVVPQHPDPGGLTVALQGTIDTFALPDVLRLLAATRKTGRLRLSGSRGSGSVWVEDGAVVELDTAQAPHATEAHEALFELLRFEEGSFIFDVDVVCEDPRPPADVEALLDAAEAQLAEWRAIEAVVPSLDAWVSLRHQLPAAEVTIDRERWATLAAVGAGATVRRIGDELCLAELAVSRAVKALVDVGVVDILDTPPAGQDQRPLVARAAPDVQPAPPPPPPPEVFDAPTPATPATPEPRADLSDEEYADDLAAQLANLSPRAAEAVRAAATATTEHEREAALDRAELAAAEDDDSVNRGLLLKFLSSVKT
jgi:hypothetical protein